MNILDIMSRRTSRRTYTGEPLSQEQAADIQNLIDQNKGSGFCAYLNIGKGDPFQRFFASYGMFSHVANYVELRCDDRQNPESLERIGYFGEKLVLRATELGLGTCWIGASYDKSKCRRPEEGETACLIALGSVPEEKTWKERLISKGVKRKSKSIDQMLTSDREAPEWLKRGMGAVCLAPSAMNGQPVKFLFKESRLFAMVEKNSPYVYIDLGIAKLHFELAAGNGRFKLGNNGEYEFDGQEKANEY